MSARARVREQFMGETRKALQHYMEDVLGIEKQAYHSNSLVGNHCAELMKNYETVLMAFAQFPEHQQKWRTFFEAFYPIWELMRAKRFLSEDEKVRLYEACKKFGTVYPKTFKKTIPSKVDDVIFALPQFTQKWGTIGGLREDEIERCHNVTNRIKASLVQVKGRGQQFLKTLQQLEKMSNLPEKFGDAQQRTFKCKECHTLAVSNNKCKNCGAVRRPTDKQCNVSESSTQPMET